jgi:hypothetical protein
MDAILSQFVTNLTPIALKKDKESFYSNKKVSLWLLPPN